VATPDTRLREYLPSARELALLFAARGIACVAAWASGFRALSDDDYARITIAQRFAQAPHLDPSGTSWLPAPFWVYGAAFRVFGTGLDVARATAIATSLAATALVFVAARLLGVNRFGALLGAALSCLLLNYSALLGVAAVPEVPSAALLLFSAATLARAEPSIRGFGAISLTAACLSRYEAWPVALVFAAFCCWDGLRTGRSIFAGYAALALLGPGLWLLSGRVEHGDALFFVARVAAYRRALGGNDTSAAKRLFQYPWLVLRDEASVWVVWLILAFMQPKDAYPGRFGRCEIALLAMLAFLMLGCIRDGVPTHHAGRVLLPIWFFGCVACGHCFARGATDRARRVQIAIIVVAIGTIPFTPGLVLAEDFAKRSDELTVGTVARRYTRSALAIDTPDYGYFAVQAGFGSPAGTSVLDDHDPRRPTPSPFSDSATLERALEAQHARFVVSTLEHAPLLAARCREQWRSARFAIFSCLPPAAK
jgi:hypothetical protein